MARGGTGRLEMDPGEGFAKVVKSNTVRGGVATAGSERNTGSPGERLALTGKRDPETTANVLGRTGTHDEGHRAVVVVEKCGVNGVERVLGVEDDLAQRAARAVGSGEKKFHGLSLKRVLGSINRRIKEKAGVDLGPIWVYSLNVGPIMGPVLPMSSPHHAHDGVKGDPTPIRWGDPVWDSVVSPVLEAIGAELARTVRGGTVFSMVVNAWKVGVPIGSNKDVAETLDWEVGDVAEGFRLVRDRLKAWADPVLELRLKEYSRELLIYPKAGVKAKGDLLLSVGGGRPEIAGMAMAGASPVAKGRGMRVICEQPEDAQEQAQVLDPSAYAGYLILPVDETDDFGAVSRLGSMGGRVALLDVATRNGGLPCVSFDYAGAGLYCAQQLIELGCENIVMITRDHDSRTYSIGVGYRRALRREEQTLHRILTVDGSILDLVGSLQLQGMLGERKLGVLCADAGLGEALLGYLDSREGGSLEIAVAVVGGKRWSARHWAELIWVELDYTELAAAGARYLTGATGASVPQVKPRFERWVPRKPAGSASEAEQETWRPMMAG